MGYKPHGLYKCLCHQYAIKRICMVFRKVLNGDRVLWLDGQKAIADSRK